MKKFLTLIAMLPMLASANSGYPGHGGGHHGDHHGGHHKPGVVCKQVEQCSVSVSDCDVSSYNGSVSYTFAFSAREKVGYVCVNRQMEQTTFEGFKNETFETSVDNSVRARQNCEIKRTTYMNRVPACSTDDGGDNGDGDNDGGDEEPLP
ncbi:hypothetical protein GW915_07710 [bacterium]|nr:hypothetical protein [bacterium]